MDSIVQINDLFQTNSNSVSPSLLGLCILPEMSIGRIQPAAQWQENRGRRREREGAQGAGDSNNSKPERKGARAEGGTGDTWTSLP